MKRSIREPDWSWTTPAGRVRRDRRGYMILWGVGFLEPGMSVLEVGCGVGTFTKFFRQPGIDVIAIDIDPYVLEKASKRVLDVRFSLGGIENFTQWGVDAVVGSSVLHHVNLRIALKRIYRMLFAGGRICFAEPNILNPQIWIERKFPGLFSYVSPHETAFHRWFIARELEKAGFVDVKVSPFDWLHPLTPKCLIPLVSWLGKWLERIPVVREFAGSLIITARKP